MFRAFIGLWIYNTNGAMNAGKGTFAVAVLASWILCFTWHATSTHAALTEQASTVLQRCSKPSSTRRPPLVLIPGFAQSIATYESHLPSLSQHQDVLLFQPLGLGNAPASWLTSTGAVANVTLPAQAEHLMSTIDRTFPDNSDQKVTVAGFSLGGRIALCAACLYPHRISHLHLTGVGYKPTPFARVSYHAWKDLLQHNHNNHNHNLSGVAWNSLLASYHPEFLQTNRHRLKSWVDLVCDTHTPRGLLALLEQTHQEEWSVAVMAEKLRKNGAARSTTPSTIAVHLCAGSDDRLSSVSQVLQLATSLGRNLNSDVTLVQGCGHAVPVEAPRTWRQSVMQFLL